MHNLVPIATNTELQLTNDNKLRIGIAWYALSPSSWRAYQLAWRQLDKFLSAKGEILDNLTDTQLTADISNLDAQGIALNILSINLAPKLLEKCQSSTFFDILSSNIPISFRIKRIGTRYECKILTHYYNNFSPIHLREKSVLTLTQKHFTAQMQAFTKLSQ